MAGIGAGRAERRCYGCWRSGHLERAVPQLLAGRSSQLKVAQRTLQRTPNTRSGPLPRPRSPAPAPPPHPQTAARRARSPPASPRGHKEALGRGCQSRRPQRGRPGSRRCRGRRVPPRLPKTAPSTPGPTLRAVAGRATGVGAERAVLFGANMGCYRLRLRRCKGAASRKMCPCAPGTWNRPG